MGGGVKKISCTVMLMKKKIKNEKDFLQKKNKFVSNTFHSKFTI